MALEELKDLKQELTKDALALIINSSKLIEELGFAEYEELVKIQEKNLKTYIELLEQEIEHLQALIK